MNIEKEYISSLNLKTLKAISDDILAKLTSRELRDSLEFRDYHEFMKARVPHEVLISILDPLSLDPDDLQAEVVQVSQDMTHQIHHHNEASAYVIILGEQSGYPKPTEAYAYLNNGWRTVVEGDRINIIKGVRHGFTVASGTELYFLSVQNPPIVRTLSADDYVLHEKVRLEDNIKPRSSLVLEPQSISLLEPQSMSLPVS